MNNTPNIRVLYDQAKEQLDAVEDEAAAVKARYAKVLAEVEAKQKTLAQEVARLADALDRAIAIADQTPTASPKPKQATTKSTPATAPVPMQAAPAPAPAPPPAAAPATQADAPPYLREVILAIPRDGDIGFTDLMDEIGISRPTLNTRLAKGKGQKWGLIESAGHGRYRLTALGKQVHARYTPAALQLVPSSTSTTGN